MIILRTKMPPMDSAVRLLRPAPPGSEDILSPAALQFLASLARRFEPERRRLLGAAVQRLARLGEHDLTSAERQILAERTHYFMVDDERGKRFVVTVGNREFPLGKSAANGQFSSRWRCWKTVKPLCSKSNSTQMRPLASSKTRR